MKRELKLTLALMALLGMTSAPASAEVKLGILPRLSATEMNTMFTPLAEYLSREIGDKVVLVIPKDFVDFKDLVARGQVDLGYSNPLIYAQLRRDANVEPLAIASEPKVGVRFRGIIVTRKDSGLATLQDLKGKKLIFVDKDSPGAYMFQLMLLRKAGLDPERDFTVLPFAKKQDNVLLAVLNKAADAGAMREPDFEKLKGGMNFDALRVIGYTDHLPGWAAFATTRAGETLAGKVKQALLKLKPESPEALSVLERANLSGFAPTTDKDFDRLREAARLAGAY